MQKYARILEWKPKAAVEVLLQVPLALTRKLESIGLKSSIWLKRREGRCSAKTVLLRDPSNNFLSGVLIANMAPVAELKGGVGVGKLLQLNELCNEFKT